jgi:hypothetical protein
MEQKPCQGCNPKYFTFSDEHIDISNRNAMIKEKQRKRKEQIEIEKQRKRKEQIKVQIEIEEQIRGEKRGINRL